MRILTIGTFDTVHVGHIRLLNICSQLGEVIVGVNSDDFVKQYKGKPPVMTQRQRISFFKELGYETHINKSAGKRLISKIMPDILAVGSDWAQKDYLKQIGVTQKWLDQYEISILYVHRPGDISSTMIKSRLHE